MVRSFFSLAWNQFQKVGCSCVMGYECSVFSVQWSVFSIQCSVFSVQCSVFSIQCSVFSSQAFGTFSLALSRLSKNSGNWAGGLSVQCSLTLAGYLEKKEAVFKDGFASLAIIIGLPDIILIPVVRIGLRLRGFLSG